MSRPAKHLDQPTDNLFIFISLCRILHVQVLLNRTGVVIHTTASASEASVLQVLPLRFVTSCERLQLQQSVTSVRDSASAGVVLALTSKPPISLTFEK